MIRQVIYKCGCTVQVEGGTPIFSSMIKCIKHAQLPVWNGRFVSRKVTDRA